MAASPFFQRFPEVSKGQKGKAEGVPPEPPPRSQPASVPNFAATS